MPHDIINQTHIFSVVSFLLSLSQCYINLCKKIVQFIYRFSTTLQKLNIYLKKKKNEVQKGPYYLLLLIGMAPIGSYPLWALLL